MNFAWRLAYLSFMLQHPPQDPDGGRGASPEETAAAGTDAAEPAAEPAAAPAAQTADVLSVSLFALAAAAWMAVRRKK